MSFKDMIFAYAVVKMNSKHSLALHLVAVMLNKYRAFRFYNAIINSILSLWWAVFRIFYIDFSVKSYLILSLVTAIQIH